MFKKTIILVLLLCLLIFNTSLWAAEEIELTAQSAIVMDRLSGRVLFERNSRAKRPMASTTKIMTALLALEVGNLDDTVKVSPRAAVTEGSSVWLEAGEIKTLEELVYGLILRSGNDAAVAIAEHISGSVEDFALLMTKKAQDIGAMDTRFKNPHGLDDEGHFTTAYDLALITRHALNIPKFREVLQTREKKISWPGNEWSRVLRNQNRLLDLYPGGDGVKTGWTTPAGRCFVGSATRDEWQIISVVLDSPRMWEETIYLLDYGFNNYELMQLIKKDTYLRKTKVEAGVKEMVEVVANKDYYLPVLNHEKDNIYFSFDVPEHIQAPVKEGQIIGSLDIYLSEEIVGSVQLVAGEDIKKAGFFLRIKQRVTVFFDRFS